MPKIIIIQFVNIRETISQNIALYFLKVCVNKKLSYVFLLYSVSSYYLMIFNKKKHTCERNAVKIEELTWTSYHFSL